MYRSRLAHGYLQKLLPDAHVSSSGVDAYDNLSGHISWYAQCLADCHDFASLLSLTWILTTQELLNEADIIVALDESIARDLVSRFTLPQNATFETWKVPDVLGAQHVYDKADDLLHEASLCWANLELNVQKLVASIESSKSSGGSDNGDKNE